MLYFRGSYSLQTPQVLGCCTKKWWIKQEIRQHKYLGQEWDPLGVACSTQGGVAVLVFPVPSSQKYPLGESPFNHNNSTSWALVLGLVRDEWVCSSFYGMLLLVVKPSKTKKFSTVLGSSKIFSSIWHLGLTVIACVLQGGVYVCAPMVDNIAPDVNSPVLA